MPSWLLSAVRPTRPLYFGSHSSSQLFGGRRDLLRVVADADHLHGDLRAPFVLEFRNQLREVRRLRRRIFDDQAFLRGIEHLRRVEERDVEWRLVALRGGEARDLVGAEHDRLRHGGAGRRLEGRRR